MSRPGAAPADREGSDRALQALWQTASALGAGLIVLLSLLSGFGWLYMFRGGHWFGLGPPVGDALPLLQLAGFDAQPLLRVVLAWWLAGGLAGVALIRMRPVARGLMAGVLGLLLLLLASQAAYAVARNLRFTEVLLNRGPGFGPVLEAISFATGCALPRSPAWLRARRRVGR